MDPPKNNVNETDHLARKQLGVDINIPDNIPQAIGGFVGGILGPVLGEVSIEAFNDYHHTLRFEAKNKWQKLPQQFVKAAQPVFTGKYNLKLTNIYFAENIGSIRNARAVTIENEIYFKHDIDWFGDDYKSDIELLLHELVHSVQYSKYKSRTEFYKKYLKQAIDHGIQQMAGSTNNWNQTAIHRAMDLEEEADDFASDHWEEVAERYKNIMDMELVVLSVQQFQDAVDDHHQDIKQQLESIKPQLDEFENRVKMHQLKEELILFDNKIQLHQLKKLKELDDIYHEYQKLPLVQSGVLKKVTVPVNSGMGGKIRTVTIGSDGVVNTGSGGTGGGDPSSSSVRTVPLIKSIPKSLNLPLKNVPRRNKFGAPRRRLTANDRNIDRSIKEPVMQQIVREPNTWQCFFDGQRQMEQKQETKEEEAKTNINEENKGGKLDAIKKANKARKKAEIVYDNASQTVELASSSPGNCKPQELQMEIKVASNETDITVEEVEATETGSIAVEQVMMTDADYWSKTMQCCGKFTFGICQRYIHLPYLTSWVATHILVYQAYHVTIYNDLQELEKIMEETCGCDDPDVTVYTCDTFFNPTYVFLSMFCCGKYVFNVNC